MFSKTTGVSIGGRDGGQSLHQRRGVAGHGEVDAQHMGEEIRNTEPQSDTLHAPDEDFECIHVEMAPDLTFRNSRALTNVDGGNNDDPLDLAFQRFHMESQKGMDIQFHIARSLTWGAVAAKMLLDSERFLLTPGGDAVHSSGLTDREQQVQGFIVLFGALTTLFPAYAYRLCQKRPHLYPAYRPLVVIADNILQVVLGCLTHNQIYPESPSDNIRTWKDAPAFKTLVVYLTGSGFAWLNMSGLLGSLPFRYAWIQQIILVAIMMLASPGMCARSKSLQRAHMEILGFVRRKLRIHSVLETTPEEAVGICVSGQGFILLLAGFIVPTFFLFTQELRMRKRFLRQQVQQYTYERVVVNHGKEPGFAQYALMYMLPAVFMLYVCIFINL